MASLSPNAKQQFFDANGNPLAGGKVYTYAAGTTTPIVTYTDSTGATNNANPIILDSRGEANIWLTPGTNYKFKLTDASEVQVWVVDNILGPPGAAAGTVTSVAIAAPALFTVSGSPVTSSGTLTLAYSGTALPVANGGTGLTTTPANGQIDIGNGTGFTRATLTAGSNVTIDNSVAGAITISAAGGGGGVTSVTATSPIASSGGATPNITFSVSPGTSGNVLTSNGSAWTSAASSFSVSPGSSGNVLTSNGSAWTSAAPSFSVSPGTSGNVLTSNGSAWTSAAPTSVTTAGAVGTYVYASISAALAFGGSTAGSNLSGAPSGTWRCMVSAGISWSSGDPPVSGIFIRIA